MLDQMKKLWSKFTGPSAPSAEAARQAALLRLSAELAAPIVEKEICQQVVKGLHETLGYDVQALFLVDEITGNRNLVASVGFKDPITPLHPGQGLSERPILNGELHYTPDVEEDSRFFYGMGGSEVDVPIWVNGKVLGVLTVESKETNDFNQDDFEVLTAAAQLTGLALEKARLLAAERKRADELDALRTTMAEITAKLELSSLLKAIVKRAAGLLDASGGELGLFDESRQEIEIVVSWNLGEDYIGLRQKIGEGAMGKVAQSGESLIIEDYQSWEGGLLNYPTIHATIATPLKVGKRLVGIFTTVSTDPERRFTQADLNLLKMFGQQAAIAIENARLYEQAKREITERERAERDLRKYQGDLKELVKERTAELQQSEERYRTLFDRVPVGLYRTTPSGEFVDVNRAMLQLLGFSNQEELKAFTTVRFYVNPEEQVSWKVLMEKEGIVRDFETQLHNRKGEKIWVRDTARVIKDQWGKVLFFEGSMEDISARKKAEAELHKYQEHLEELVEERTAELRESEHRYSTLFDGVPIGLYRSNPDGYFVDVNLALVQMLRYPDRETLLETKTINTYVDPEVQDRWKELMEQEGVVRDYETHGRRYDGTSTWFSDTARAVKDEEDNILYYEGKLEDITERKRLELEIRRQKDYFEAIFVNSPVAIVTADLEGTIVSWNPYAEKLFQYSQDEVIGRNLDDIVANDDSIREEAKAYTRDVIEVGRVQATTRRTRKDGNMVDVELSALPVIVGEDKIGFISIYLDLTERMQYEKEISRQKEYFEALFVNSPVAIVTADLVGTIVSWNPAAEKLFQYSRDEVIGRNLDDIVANDDSIRQEGEAYTREVIEAGRVQATTRRTRKDGSMVDVELSALPVIVGQEKIGFIAIYVDIADLQAARREAEAANKAKSIFLANMSHELRTPLNAILGFTQLMDQDPNLTLDQQDNLRIINQSGEHLLTLINDVLEMSKIEAGRQTLREKSFDIHLLLDGLEEIFRVKAAEKDLNLSFKRADDLPQHIVADANRLRQVLMNLLGNAVKFTQKGGVTLRVEASPQSTPSWTGNVNVHFEVEDTGPGITTEETKAVFEPFVQVINDDHFYEGTGLGLSISRQFVRLMGGDLTVTSTFGQGSTFKFDILVELADEVDVPEIQPLRRVLGVVPGQENYKLLIVEDRDTNRRLLRKILKPLGFEVREAVNGKQAIELWENWSPHLIFMDMQIPIIDGYEAIKEIKEKQQALRIEKPEREDSIIIALTASAFEEDREKILSAGCDDFIRKPFHIETIYELLAKHLSVQYEYADDSLEAVLTADQVDNDSGQDIISSEIFAKLPEGIITTLQDAVIKANLLQIQAAIQQIKDLDPQLGVLLLEMVNNFEYKKILSSIDPSRDSE